MEVKLQLYSVLRDKLPPESKGRAVLRLHEGVTLAELIDELGIKRRVVISVNDVHEADKSRQLQDGDEVKIFSSVSGGCYSIREYLPGSWLILPEIHDRSQIQRRENNV